MANVMPVLIMRGLGGYFGELLLRTVVQDCGGREGFSCPFFYFAFSLRGLRLVFVFWVHHEQLIQNPL